MTQATEARGTYFLTVAVLLSTVFVMESVRCGEEASHAENMCARSGQWDVRTKSVRPTVYQPCLPVEADECVTLICIPIKIGKNRLELFQFLRMYLCKCNPKCLTVCPSHRRFIDS